MADIRVVYCVEKLNCGVLWCVSTKILVVCVMADVPLVYPVEKRNFGVVQCVLTICKVTQL